MIRRREAWQKLDTISKEEARSKYVALVTLIDPKWEMEPESNPLSQSEVKRCMQFCTGR